MPLGLGSVNRAVSSRRRGSLVFRNRSNNQRDREGFEDFLLNLEAIPPKALEQRLLDLGYRGQRKARQALCLFAYRHTRRIIRVFREGYSERELPSKLNYLLMGPTGCGKTYITELLFNRILNIPSVTVDITAYSETGYVGQDTSAILTRLLHASDHNPLLARIGVVCLDEFDKLSSGSNNAVFAGAGTTKDVTGRGVQRELLKMLEGSDVEVSAELSQASYGGKVVLTTRNISFVACGAFSGFKTLSDAADATPNIGFGRESSAGGEAIAVHLTQEEVERTAHFQRYGFMPELIGRFTRVIPFEPLDESTLLEILEDSVIQAFTREFEGEGVDLEITDAVATKGLLVRHLVMPAAVEDSKRILDFLAIAIRLVQAI